MNDRDDYLLELDTSTGGIMARFRLEPGGNNHTMTPRRGTLQLEYFTLSDKRFASVEGLVKVSAPPGFVPVAIYWISGITSSAQRNHDCCRHSVDALLAILEPRPGIWTRLWLPRFEYNFIRNHTEGGPTPVQGFRAVVCRGSCGRIYSPL